MELYSKTGTAVRLNFGSNCSGYFFAGPKASALSHFSFRVDRLQFYPSVVDLELPIDAALSGVAVIVPRGCFFAEFGSVSKVEMAAPMALIYMALFPSISTFETPPSRSRRKQADISLGRCP